MAHYVGKELSIRPSSILDEWGVPELLIAYGEYVNELADKNYKQWENMDVQVRMKIPKPPKYYVQFIGVEEMRNGGQSRTNCPINRESAGDIISP